MGKLPGLCEPGTAVCRDNKETLGLLSNTAKEKNCRSYVESRRELSTAIWAAALKLVRPCRMMVILPLLNVARPGSDPTLPPWVT